jgi:hypothetical protein
MLKKLLLSFLVVFLFIVVIGGWMAVDFLRNDKIGKEPSRPESSLNTNIDQVLYDLEEGNIPDYSIITTTMRYVDGRYDVSDFRLQSTTRILYEHADNVPSQYLDDIKDTVIGFKYWMDQPGDDSMCFWSENHTLLFATSEYLLGLYYENEVFTNDGLTGAEHSQLGKARVLTWLEQRWLYGFTEFFSNTYYVEDIAPLSNLIDFAPDEEIRIKAKIILDLLLYDLTSQSFKGTFTSVSGRMYENGKKYPDRQSMRTVAESFLDYEVGTDRIGMDLNFIYVNDYEVPEVFKEIGHDESEVIIKASNGLNLNELKERDLIGLEDNQIMMQWGMEAFTNPEIITNSMKYINKHGMLTNEFLNDFKMINITFLRELGFLPAVSRLLNPKTNGVAIQRGNSYTYKNEDFFMATLQNHHPGEFADQQHVFTVSLSPSVTVFHQHPAKALGEGALSNSPGYWVGYGRFPHSVQDEAVNLSIYDLPDKTGFMENNLFYFTHAYFPTTLFDDYSIEGRYAFAKVGDTFLALIGLNDLYLGQDILDTSITSTDDLIQDGQTTYWITEVSSISQDSNFQSFINRIKSYDISFDEDNLKLTYSGEKNHELNYKGNYYLDSNLMDLEYKRMDSPYAIVDREALTMTLSFNGKSLYLDFYNLERSEENDDLI